MVAGRHGGYNYEFRDREMDPEASRRKEQHMTRYRDDRRRYPVSSGKRREYSNGYDTNNTNPHHNNHSDNTHRNHRALDPKRSSILGRLGSDREPGELSSGSGSDDSGGGPHMPARENGVATGEKRKFSPIIWDRDGSGNNVGSKSKKDSLPLLPPLPPPPMPPQNGGDEPSAPTSPMELEVLVDSPRDSVEAKPMGEEEADEYPTMRHISSSRWAEAGDEEEEAAMPVTKKKRSASPSDSGEKLRKKVMTPELGEVVVGDHSGGKVSSGSEGVHEDEDGELEVDRDDYMDVDRESVDDDDDVSGSLSGRGSGSESESDSLRSRTLEPAKQPHRCIDMLQGCRSVDEFERLNKINEGTYGVVYRARDKKTGEIVALKKVKMEKEREGFPLTSLREINILLSFHHPSVVDVKEVVVGSNLDQIFMVMEYMEHDLKGVMETMKQPYSQSEVKCLMLQLLEGVKHLHDNWVLHRDLKASNLLLNNRGELKICDFGLSRQYGSPLKPYTQLVVTLWYRAPELLLGAKEYSTAIDMWSLGCIMAELLAKEPLFNGKSEFDQLDKIFRMLGTPNEKIWPGFVKLPGVKVNFVKQPYNRLREKFPPASFSGRPTLSEAGFDLLNKLLTYDPEKRITADAALKHDWFREVPLPKSKDFMPTFPALNEQNRLVKRVLKSPDPLEEQRRKELQGNIGNRGLFG